MAWENNHRKVIVETDSTMVVSLMSLEAPNLRCELTRQCREMIGKEWTCQVKHIFREANVCADRLAHLSYELGEGLHMFHNVPHQIAIYFNNDLMDIG